mmetsp:Transcript_3092/g.8779  ORF Transcript_3092/g.8779 Transcript_3092/m.8779 type:complete len:193 (-) Transcript_3092:253-831(-)|eukprot:CAMPEP_0118885486 /NCGR_PEP_ID=MMETSP1163-20130328/23943_1 /TAXON_ID=124430 /ORGANISM="Phaeomonas parva, Strain CCMP2877" /LENGTH=192 /DNA_ID=CAMNT_0006823509 /DNA_START=276 /DNA_END=854 /DNA_ORIENTATION=+
MASFSEAKAGPNEREFMRRNSGQTRMEEARAHYDPLASSKHPVPHATDRFSTGDIPDLGRPSTDSLGLGSPAGIQHEMRPRAYSMPKVLSEAGVVYEELHSILKAPTIRKQRRGPGSFFKNLFGKKKYRSSSSSSSVSFGDDVEMIDNDLTIDIHLKHELWYSIRDVKRFHRELIMERKNEGKRPSLVRIIY